jgi:hypothetical protein
MSVQELLKGQINANLWDNETFCEHNEHRDVGFTANGMVVWKVPRQSRRGRNLRYFSVSHCYRGNIPGLAIQFVQHDSCKNDQAKKICVEMSRRWNGEYKILFSSRNLRKRE